MTELRRPNINAVLKTIAGQCYLSSSTGVLAGVGKVPPLRYVYRRKQDSILC